MTTGAEAGGEDVRASLAGLEQRFADLERRLSRLETPVQPPAPQPEEQEFAPPVPAPLASVPEPSVPIPDTLKTLVASSQTRRDAGAGSAPPLLPRAAFAAAPRREPEALENTIGKAWASWIGGLFVLGALLLFMKLAWDRGWLPGPAMRIVLSLVAGVILLGLGEWIFRRKMAALAASLTGTGLAVLMAAFFAANVAFATPVLSQPTAFFAVMAVGALGIALALRMKMMPLAILALLGMYLSPAILGSREDHSLQLLVYLAIVTAAGLTLSFCKHRWPAVRAFVFVAGWVWLLVWVNFGNVADHVVLAMLAGAGFFLMYLLEMTAAVIVSMRAVPSPANPDVTVTTAAQASAMLVLENAVALLSIANSALAMIAFAVIFNRLNIPGLWIVPLVMGGLMTAIRFLTRSRALTLSAGVQALGLFTLAAPLYFNGSAITFAWGVMGMVLGIYAYVMGSRPARVWTLVMLGLVGSRIFFFDQDTAGAQQVIFTLGTETITRWMLMGWSAGIYALLLAWLARPRPGIAGGVGQSKEPIANRGDLWVTALCVLGGSIVWCVVSCISLHPAGPLTLMALAWVLAVNGLSAISVPPKDAAALETAALFILVFIFAKWTAYDGLELSVVDPSGLPGVIPFLNAFVFNGLLLIAAILTSRELRAGGRLFLAWLVAGICFITLNVEMLRATDTWLSGWLTHAGLMTDRWILKNVVLSVLWGVIGLIAVQVGFMRKIPSIRWAALVLLGITVAKVLLVDMANVGTFPRVVSFLVVGAALLLVSFVYHRMSQPRLPAA